jgi:hypothetical protein
MKDGERVRIRKNSTTLSFPSISYFFKKVNPPIKAKEKAKAKVSRKFKLTSLAFAHAYALKLYRYFVIKNKMQEILKNIPFFADLSEEDLQAIIDKVQMQYFDAEHVIFNEGDTGDYMYIIKRGQAQVIRNNTILAVLSDNQFFGEMALVSDEPRNATVKTVTDVEVLTLNKDDFKTLLETKPSIASIVSYEVVKRANAIS